MIIMKCDKCGFNEAVDGKHCPKCGNLVSGGVREAEAVVDHRSEWRGREAPRPQKKISNNLVIAIIVTLCCCPPFGIPSIVYAARVDTMEKYGDIEGAREASKKANFWAVVGLAAGLLWVVLYTLLSLVPLIMAGNGAY